MARAGASDALATGLLALIVAVGGLLLIRETRFGRRLFFTQEEGKVTIL